MAQLRVHDTHAQNRFLMLGLDNAGKTTLLYALKLGEVVTTAPTIGFNMEEIQIGASVAICTSIV